jgi:enoyl-CoA hydratase/carnithine racemase
VVDDAVLLVDRQVGAGVAVLTLNRPQVHNAINSPMLQRLYDAMVELEHDPNVRAVVLTGAGERAFSAGADIHETAGRTPEQEAASGALWGRWNGYLATYPKPTIGALNGLVYGGAAQLAAMVDIRVGCDHTSFRFLYASVGRIVGTWILPLVVGWARAQELLLTARVVEANEAYRIGLLNHLVPSDRLLTVSVQLAELIAKHPPATVQGIKAVLREQIGMGYLEAYRHEQEARQSRYPAVPFQDAFKDFLTRKGPPTAGS